MKIELLPWKCTGANTILEKPSDNRLLLRQALQVDLQNIVPTKICALILPYIKKNQVCKNVIMYNQYLLLKKTII